MDIKELIQQIVIVADAARSQGQTVEIENGIDSKIVRVEHDSDTVYHFAYNEAESLIDEAKAFIETNDSDVDLTVEDFILYSSQSW